VKTMPDLQKEYLFLVNVILPTVAQAQELPVSANHCFARIILDNVMGQPWRNVLLNKAVPACRQLTRKELVLAIAIGESIAHADECHKLNQKSLNWRAAAH
jgi:hypothetical protein